MAYKVARIKLVGWHDKFKEAPDDTDFAADSYPELDDYLSTMEDRGWTVVSTAVAAATNGMGYFLYVTLHQPEPEPSPKAG